METFTLMFWLYVGLRYEELSIEGILGRDECIKQLRAIEFTHSTALQQTGRSSAKGRCVGASGYVYPSETREPRECASCGLLPGRRRI